MQSLLFISILSCFIYSVALLPEGIEPLHWMLFTYLICLNVFQYLLNRFLLLLYLSLPNFLEFVSYLFLIKFSLFLYLQLRILARLASWGIPSFCMMNIALTANRWLTITVIWSRSTPISRNPFKQFIKQSNRWAFPFLYLYLISFPLLLISWYYFAQSYLNKKRHPIFYPCLQAYIFNLLLIFL